jgi:glycosyltransferase involved in cell wall biosynthesis
MRNLRSEQEIMQHWESDVSKPLVSIGCLTYNHEPYIEDALEGFLIQETNFPFEIIIHDDASTDRTAYIIGEYETKYPNLIKPIYQTENQYLQGKLMSQFLMPSCKGEYIAYCDGDDYWTDPQKLQIQFDFLESNPDYVISGHNAFVIDEQGRYMKASQLPDTHMRDCSSEELIMGRATFLTMSWMYRNVIHEFAPELNMVVNGDYFLLTLLGHFGKGKYHDDIKPSAYRIRPGSIWSTLNGMDKISGITNTFLWMYHYYNRIGETPHALHYWEMYYTLVFQAMGAIGSISDDSLEKHFY